MIIKMRPLIIITDPAPEGDDAVAIAMIVGDGRVDIRLITATSGNVWAEEAAHNARNLLSRLGRDDIEICVHMPSPAFQDRQSAIALGDYGPPALRYIGAFSRKFSNTLEGLRVCDDVFEQIATENRPDLLIIGPASPIAPILSAHPELVAYVGRVYLMGGAITCEGNATPTAEFNFWFDPEAAEALLASDLPVTLLPLDITRTFHYSSEFAATLDPKHPVAKYVHNCVAHVTSLTVCDEVLAAALLDRSLVSHCRALKLSVETKPGLRYGAVNILDDSAKRRPVEVIEKIEKGAFWRLARRALAFNHA
jgi:inosine-uridine nucleoside N-ribohydrolase